LQPYLQNGDRIELVVEDDKNDPALTVERLKKLVEKDRVSAIITFSSSKPVLAMGKVADKHKTPILAALATHPDITKDNGFISQLAFDDDFQGTVAALFVRDDLLIDTVAVFNDPTSVYSSYLAAEFERKFKSIGGEITDRIALAEETAELSEVIKGVYDHTPELLYLPLSVKDVIRVVREVRKLDWKPEMMGSDGLISTMIAQHKEEINLVEGMLATDHFAHRMLLTPFGKRAAEMYSKMYKDTGTAHVALGAEGYALLLDASTGKSVQRLILWVLSATLRSGQTANPGARFVSTPFRAAARNFYLKFIKPIHTIAEFYDLYRSLLCGLDTCIALF
jgi:branched-chain amino acid transport system substrate-binding protein